MALNQDFKDLLGLFNKNHVDYIIVGAFALALHGAPRYTGDLDLLVKSDTANAERIMKSLVEFGFGSLDLSEKDFLTPGQVVQLGYPPVRIDLLTSITGVSWEEAFTERVEAHFDDTPVAFLGKKELIKNKRALGRARDLADLEAIGTE